MLFPKCTNITVNQVGLRNGFEKLDAFFVVYAHKKALTQDQPFKIVMKKGTNSKVSVKVYSLF